MSEIMNLLAALGGVPSVLVITLVAAVVFWKNSTPFARLRDLILAFRAKK